MRWLREWPPAQKAGSFREDQTKDFGRDCNDFGLSSFFNVEVLFPNSLNCRTCYFSCLFEYSQFML